MHKEYGGGQGEEPSQIFYKGGSAPAEILLNLIAVTILANPETLDVVKKTTLIHSNFILFINYLYSWAILADLPCIQCYCHKMHQ